MNLNFSGGGTPNMSKEELIKVMKSPMMKQMMGDEYADDCEKMLDDPKMVAQLQGMWKHLDEMASTDEKGYKDFIEKQRKEFETEQKKMQAEKEKKRIIEGNQLCCIKMLPAKIVVQNKNKNLSDSIKLFDFESNAEINQSFLENEDA